MRVLLAGIFFAILALQTLGASALEIRNVHHDHDVLEPGKSTQVTIRFTLSDLASVVLNIYDGRDLLIRYIEKKEPLGAGEHVLVWDAKDQAGKGVPPGAYHYTLQAKTATGEKVEHDLTDLTGGEDVAVKDVQWDSEQGTLHYILTANAYVSVRLGLKKGGPLLRTLIDWVPRKGGVQIEAWDGMDESGVLDLSRHPQLMIGVQAFSISDNTILVDPNETSVQLVKNMTWGEIRREVKKQPQKRMYKHAQQSLETRGDFAIELKVPDDIALNNEGIPIVTGTVPIRLDVDDRDRARALARRFEQVFYLDGIYVFENETGFLPRTWRWEADKVNPGIHYLTANLRGYEGNFGMATLKVEVRRKKKEDTDGKPRS